MLSASDLTAKTDKKFIGIQKCSINGYRVKDLFQMVLNAPDLWRHAYLKIRANPGNMTKGTDGQTIDGYSEERAANLRELLRENRYVPTPVRRVYIPKANGKMRPLGIPNAWDKQVQEVWREILEAIYEPVFSDKSHGFRPGRSCHTALDEIKHKWTGMKWFIEFDIEGFFDNINHQILMEMLEKKIDDVKFLNIIRKMLKAGYMEDWKFHRTMSGTPQGGIISPILANIYLHELDNFVENLIQDFERGDGRRMNPEYVTMRSRMSYLNRKVERETDLEKRSRLLEEKKGMQREVLQMPSGDHYDPHYRRLRYCRYADDFVLGVIGSKSDAVAIMEKLKAFLSERLQLKHSEAKTGLKHNSEVIRFLGYDISVINSEKVRKMVIGGRHCKRRTGKGHISLYAPYARLQKFATERLYGNWELMDPLHKPFLMQAKEHEIIQQYSTEMRGIAEYYKLADNYSKAIGRLYFLGKGSFLKSIAAKHQTTVHKISSLLDRGGYTAVRVRRKDGEVKEFKLFHPRDVNRDYIDDARVDFPILTFQFTSSTELLQRMEARKCEYCEHEEGYFEVHHIRKLADIHKGKAPWEKFMISRRRKTLVLCIRCHDLLHAGTLPDRRHLWKREAESRVR